MSPQKVIRYDDFRGGEFGRLGPEHAPKNSFTGSNMLVTRQGRLCVRPGVRDVTPSGLSNGTVGKLLGVNSGSTRYAVFTQGTSAYRFIPDPVPGSATALTGSFTSAPTQSGSGVFEEHDTAYLVTSGDKAYSLTSSAVSALTNSPDGTSIAKFGIRMVIGSGDTLEYSGADDFTSWPGNIITIGNAVNALHPQRTHLTVCTESDGIYVLTGTLTDDATAAQLRRATTALGPKLNHSTVLRDDLIWFGSNTLYSSTQIPSMFDGTRVRRLNHLPVSNGISSASLSISGFRNTDDSSLILVDPTGSATNDVLLFWNGVWTRHVIDVDVAFRSEAITAAGFAFSDDPDDATFTQMYDCTGFTFTDGGGASATPNFWTWCPGLDRPGCETATTNRAPERAGDDSAAQVEGSVSFPYMKAETGEEWCVRHVIVDGIAYDTGGSSTNHFDISVDAVRRYDDIGSRSSDTLSWDEDGDQFADSGTPFSASFSFGDQGFGHAAQLHLSNVRGVAIDSITVVVDVRPARWA